VLNSSGVGRLLLPFLFDPDFDALLNPIDLANATIPEDDKEQRWDNASVHSLEGTYGAYLLGKVSKVFPDLGESELG
jgi:isopenicillin N synthase-like dioxygenase